MGFIEDLEEGGRRWEERKKELRDQGKTTGGYKFFMFLTFVCLGLTIYNLIIGNTAVALGIWLILTISCLFSAAFYY